MTLVINEAIISLRSCLPELSQRRSIVIGISSLVLGIILLLVGVFLICCWPHLFVAGAILFILALACLSVSTYLFMQATKLIQREHDKNVQIIKFIGKLQAIYDQLEQNKREIESFFMDNYLIPSNLFNIYFSLCEKHLKALEQNVRHPNFYFTTNRNLVNRLEVLFKDIGRSYNKLRYELSELVEKGETVSSLRREYSLNFMADSIETLMSDFKVSCFILQDFSNFAKDLKTKLEDKKKQSYDHFFKIESLKIKLDSMEVIENDLKDLKLSLDTLLNLRADSSLLNLKTDTEALERSESVIQATEEGLEFIEETMRFTSFENSKIFFNDAYVSFYKEVEEEAAIYEPIWDAYRCFKSLESIRRAFKDLDSEDWQVCLEFLVSEKWSVVEEVGQHFHQKLGREERNVEQAVFRFIDEHRPLYEKKLRRLSFLEDIKNFYSSEQELTSAHFDRFLLKYQNILKAEKQNVLQLRSLVNAGNEFNKNYEEVLTRLESHISCYRYVANYQGKILEVKQTRNSKMKGSEKTKVSRWKKNLLQAQQEYRKTGVHFDYLFKMGRERLLGAGRFIQAMEDLILALRFENYYLNGIESVSIDTYLIQKVNRKWVGCIEHTMSLVEQTESRRAENIDEQCQFYWRNITERLEKIFSETTPSCYVL